ncbi:energy transducer TonB [uncultured Vibrio sp.]|uniref:energy transducer TonB n=1 Tax=uncultured Vibrio sp. TaxID=114054 RepID=UPI0025E27A5A|nr:TonB family protein [uncultured Vibrio sp.]
MGYKHYLVFGGLSFAIHSLAFSASYKPITVSPIGESSGKAVSIQFIATPAQPSAPERTAHQAAKTKSAKAEPVTSPDKIQDRKLPKAEAQAQVQKKVAPVVAPTALKPEPKLAHKPEPKSAPIERKSEQANKPTPRQPEPVTPVSSEPVLTKEVLAKKAQEKTPIEIEKKVEEVAKAPSEKTITPSEIQAVSQTLDAAQLSPTLVSKPTFETRPSAISYPRSAKRRNIQGNVLVEVWLDEEGEQTNLIIVNSSGHQILDSAALRGISEWEFRQHKTQGHAIAHRVQIPINFKLD